VRDITTNPDDAAIAEAIIAMSHAMGIRVIAEGIETTEQQSFLVNKDCDLAQGFLFARPMLPEKIAPLLAKGESGQSAFSEILSPQPALF